MIRRRGEMFESPREADLFLVTTNSTLRGDGSLVMGKGAAKQARKQITDEQGKEFLHKRMGREVAKECGDEGRYGLLLGPDDPWVQVGIFQTKTHYSKEASLSLIAQSCMQLLKWTAKNPKSTVFLNYPGIGNGRLSKDEVAPIVNELPDTVQIWTYK